MERADDPGRDAASCGATWPSAVADATTNIAPVPAPAIAVPITTLSGLIDTAGTAIPTAAVTSPVTASGAVPPWRWPGR